MLEAASNITSELSGSLADGTASCVQVKDERQDMLQVEKKQ